MNRRLHLALLLLLPAAAGAQGTTREQIDRAIAQFNNFQVEAAQRVLQGIIAPSYLQPVSPAERVDVYKYLGASYALLNFPDTARTYFTAALDFDPFTDLDQDIFGPQEIAAFNRAKAAIFKVGVGQIRSRLIRPREDSTWYTFRVITTSRAQLDVAILSQPDSNRVRETLFQDMSDGLRQLRWNGVLRNGQFADTGIYMVRVAASRDGGQPSTSWQYFRIEHHLEEPPEDTLPPFRPDQLLQDRIPTSAPYMDLAKGLFAGLASYGFASVTLNSDVSGWQTHAVGASLVGVVAGTWSFLYRRNNRTIGPNAEENARRQAERARHNAAVEARNRARLDARWIIITPIAGFSR